MLYEVITMRDSETAEIGIRAAITGHLVLSTLHTNDAATTITRLCDMGIPPYLVATSIIGVVAQRLVKLLCPECKAKRRCTAEEKVLLNIPRVTNRITSYNVCYTKLLRMS